MRIERKKYYLGCETEIERVCVCAREIERERERQSVKFF